jgi:hypothetical protein
LRKRLTATLDRFLDDPTRDKRLFLHKFMVLQNSDIYISATMVFVLLVDSHLLKTERGLSAGREPGFLAKFSLVSGIEICIDCLIYVCYGAFLKQLLFRSRFSFSQGYGRFLWNLKSNLLLSTLVLFLLCFYIRYHAVLVE